MVAGARAIITGIVKRPELNGREVTLLSPHDGRWAVTFVVGAGEGVRIKSDNLVPCPGLLDRELPAALLRLTLLQCDPPALRSIGATCRELHEMACEVQAAPSYIRRLDVRALVRWRASRSVYGFIRLSEFQQHRPHPLAAGFVAHAGGGRVVHSAARGVAHLWDTAAGVARVGFAAPQMVSSTIAGVHKMTLDISLLALSASGWLAASMTYPKPADEEEGADGCAPGKTLWIGVYDARGADAGVEPGSSAGARTPRLQHKPEHDVISLGWTSPTEIVSAIVAPELPLGRLP